jgi:UDP-N-acetylglucosamine--N-acetylmuramyl-(pentapeptide) pyrophosphoryl-undecaprenol N-acetylglucosamine transferase
MPISCQSGKCINVSSLRIIFAGGGTGGHLFPAIAIADEIRNMRSDAVIAFIGTREKIEARVVPQKGYQFFPIWISGFHRSFRIKNLLFPIKVIISFMQAVSIIKYFQPDIVVGTGGYVSGPALRAATFLKIPTLIQEQNSYPGVTTRVLGKKVDEVHLTFGDSKKYFSGLRNIFVTGNPTRADLINVNRNIAVRFFKFDESDPMKTILIFGGSLGAHSINKAIEDNIDSLMQNNLRLIWQTGKEDMRQAKVVTKKYSKKRVWVNEFIDRMDYAYAASDLVICRAGATTIAELTLLGKPAILIPYPYSAANHQVENAKSIAETGAAEIVSDQEISEKLLSVVMKSIDGSNLQRMSEQSKKIGKPDAAKKIAERIQQLAGHHGRS